MTNLDKEIEFQREKKIKFQLEQAYSLGFSDGYGACDTDAKTETIDMMMHFFPDPPCCYNNMDELTSCDWCAEHCSFPTNKSHIRDCWKHAIEEKWWKNGGKW